MYIDRKAYSKDLKDLIADSDGRTNYEKGYIQGLATANGILLDKNQTPSADVVEVVRCKECENCRLSTRGDSRYCTEHSDGWGNNLVYVDEDDFCSFGERKKENA